MFLFGGILGTLHHLYWTGTPTSVIAVGVGVLRARSRAADADRPRSAADLPAFARPRPGSPRTSGRSCASSRSASGTPSAPACSASRSTRRLAVLRAGPEHDGRPRPRRAVRRVRHARHRPDAVLPARPVRSRSLHADGLLKPAFWSLNIGLAMMVFMSLLPAGIYQAWASITKGLWYARSPEIVHSPRDGDAGLAARARRHRVRRRRACSWPGTRCGCCAGAVAAAPRAVAARGADARRLRGSGNALRP